MAVTMADITKLRHLTSAGLMDCKKALAETDGDIEKAVEILRKKGQAIAAKREDREAAEGCVLAKNDGEFAAIVALKCETDFVAKNEGFVNLTKAILAAAVEAKAKSIDEVKEIELNGQKIADLIVQESGKTGEKMELGAYEYVEAPATIAYNHFGNKLATIVAFNKSVNEQACKNVAMQVAAMNPLAVDECDVAEEIKEKEIAVAIEKTKAEQVQKAVDAALKKAGINPAHVDSEDHMESNKAKGWITEEDVAKAKEIIATVSAEKAANLPEAMIQNIAKGRLGKFLKEVCLLNQEDVTSDDKKSVRETLKSIDPELKVISFKRVNLNVD
ncbi:MAG: elongation factor Ts [Muribaculaceae bacterium]|nr:elongation factor Ts [Muribaculaceae bacterium]